jgi:hypothetical protein
MFGQLLNLALEPYPIRSLTKAIVKKFELGKYETRLWMEAIDRPHYGYCLYEAASLAKKLGYSSISALEFGVSGGNGLVCLEYHARNIAPLLGIDIEIYGFDNGTGLPEPEDYRDLPYHWQQGFFKMDVPKLQARLTTSKLVLGDVRETVTSFFDKYNPAPVGAIFHDLDFYSSTVPVLKMLEAGHQHHLPRLFCYFDDTIGSEKELYNDYTGQRLAINEFNQTHEAIKLAVPYYLLTRPIVETWYHQIRVCHFFQHPDYNRFVSEENQMLPLQG